MPGRYPEFIKPAVIDVAKRLHTCHRDSKHAIAMGDKRLTLGTGQEQMRYCGPCSRVALDNAEKRLAELREELERDDR